MAVQNYFAIILHSPKSFQNSGARFEAVNALAVWQHIVSDRLGRVEMG